ncbi:MAG: hypothetical protein JOZ39_09790 [Chloroflexi bacterium]|nr:hypothetical protein [Chloroflexota bacterium]
MRKITLKLSDGSDAGAIVEGDDGKLTGEGRGANLVQLAPGKDFEGWKESFTHTKYLTTEVQE